MDLTQAQDEFDTFLDNINEYQVADFLNYVNEKWFVKQYDPFPEFSKIRKIADDIKELVPLNAILSSEKICLESKNKDSHVEHMDSFLYDCYELVQLEIQNRLSRYYCKNCSSHNVALKKFKTHSVPRSLISFIFAGLLKWPDVNNKCILDVGSRFGAMLYGAYFYTTAKKIIGVEMNRDLCDIQQQIINKHHLEDRTEVICDDICNQSEIVKNAEVIILYNVFEFFLTEEHQIKTWKFLRNHIKPKTILITSPNMEKSLQNLKIEIDVKEWIKKRPIKDPLLAKSLEDHIQLSELCIYEVL